MSLGGVEPQAKWQEKSEISEGVGWCFVGWCACPFIVEFREILINKSPKTYDWSGGRVSDIIILGFGYKWEICFWGCFASLGNMTHGEYLW